jgi:hypothetical protein
MVFAILATPLTWPTRLKEELAQLRCQFALALPGSSG